MMLAATLYQRTVDRAEPHPLCFFMAPLSEIETQKTLTNVNRCRVQSQGLLTLQKVVNPNQRGQFVVWHARSRLECRALPHTRHAWPASAAARIRLRIRSRLSV
jgi:hypothetical protein